MKKKELTVAERIHIRLATRLMPLDDEGEFDRFADADNCIKIIGNHTDKMQALNDSQAETIKELEREKAELTERLEYVMKESRGDIKTDFDNYWKGR